MFIFLAWLAERVIKSVIGSLFCFIRSERLISVVERLRDDLANHEIGEFGWDGKHFLAVEHALSDNLRECHWKLPELLTGNVCYLLLNYVYNYCSRNT